MQEKEAIIAVYNEEGIVIEKKPRKDINKEKDILKTANIILINNKNQIFMIKANDFLWKDKWGGSCAGLVRHKETPKQAAKRTLKRELNINIKLQHLAENFHNFNSTKRFLSVFLVKTNNNPIINLNDIKEGKWISFKEAQILINNNKCMPTFESSFEILKKHLN
jgi:isopentenyldiphosphate isomerase